MNIVYVYADTQEIWNTSNWRCAIPTASINAAGGHASLVPHEGFASGDAAYTEVLRNADFIVVERKPIGLAMQKIFEYIALGIFVFVDIDDGYMYMPRENPAYSFWHKGVYTSPSGEEIAQKYTPLVQSYWGISLASGLTSPSRIILDDYREFNKNTEFIPNVIPYSEYKKWEPRKDDNKIRIGWGGSTSHTDSWFNRKQGIVDALVRLYEENKGIQFHIAGDLRVAYALQEKGLDTKFHPWVDYKEWTGWLSTIDVGLAPLYGHYDERRSWLKPLEYATVGIPWIGSSLAPNFQFNRNANLVKRDPGKKPEDQWYHAIVDVLENLEAYRAKAEIESAFVEANYNAAHYGDKLIDAYTRLAERSAEERETANEEKE